MELYPGASAEAIGSLLIFPFIVSFSFTSFLG